MRHDSGNHQRTDHSHGSVMKELRENGGIPGGIILLMAVMAGLTVASIYYNQPLLGMISRELDISHFTADMMTVVTQAGYAAGLMLVLPAGDLWSRRRIVIACMLASALMLLAISLSGSIYLICAASFVLGVSSVVPQLFIPLTAQFSEPRNRTRNIGFVLSGLLTGILAARVISGFLGEWLGWRAMFLIAAAVMVICTAVCLFLMPLTKTNFSGTYLSLLRSIIAIVREHPRIRLNSVRSAFGFGSMLTLWACMAFHLAGEPFFCGSDAVGWLGLCGMAGAIAASGMGRIIPRFGVKRLCVTGALIQLLGWGVAFIFGGTWAGLIAALILVDVGTQCQQLSGQSGALAEIPGASSRVNTVFMATFFVGGCLGTFFAGLGWEHLGWAGVCLTGALFASGSLLVSAFDRK